ncbi:MAG: hypothetical protein AAFY11_01915 [Cyanobacteria bacterium J06641_5]
MALVRTIERGSIEAAVFQVRDGYRATMRNPSFHWHPGVFPDLDLLWNWLHFQVATVESGLPLSSDWLPLNGDRPGNCFYRDWFVYRLRPGYWHGYDPLTNRCYTAKTYAQLRAKIDSCETQRQQSA